MEEVIIKFLDIATIKFIGTPELIELVKKYYPGLENKKAKENYTIKLNTRILPTDLKIPLDANFQRCFAGPHYYSWKNGEYNLAYSPPEERGGSHIVIRKGNNFQVMFHKGELPNQIVGISREILTKEALSKGYMPIHASVVSKDGKGFIFFGGKNKGKSTSFFSSIIYDNARPMSGDVAVVRKDDNGWKVIGWPWTATIDQSFFDLTKRVPKQNIPNKGKIKYLPADFCEEFSTQWIWEEPLEQIINVDLNPNTKAALKTIKPEELKERLERFGKEEWWRWGDVFGLGKKEPIYEYEEISQDIQGKVLTGDIIQLFKERENEREL